MEAVRNGDCRLISTGVDGLQQPEHVKALMGMSQALLGDGANGERVHRRGIQLGIGQGDQFITQVQRDHFARFKVKAAVLSGLTQAV